jgi:hypothetical protein
MQLIIGLQEALWTLAGFAAIQFVLGAWFKSRLDASIKAEKDQLMEEYKYQIKAREQASKVAEYFSYYFRLKPDSSEADYRKANQLAWELALWLPEEIYRDVTRAASSSNAENNIFSALLSVRGLLLKEPGNLTQDDILFHAPNANAHKSPAAAPTKTHANP